MMETRLPPDQIKQGLKTKSDKIQALALANYDRTEIAEYLNIRYLHVRKVLPDSGSASDSAEDERRARACNCRSRAGGHSEPGTTKLYDRRGYNPEKSASFFAAY